MIPHATFLLRAAYCLCAVTLLEDRRSRMRSDGVEQQRGWSFDGKYDCFWMGSCGVGDNSVIIIKPNFCR